MFYWNTSDTSDHIHKRIEWSIANNHLICMNIFIDDKIIQSINNDAIILAYEPKCHKISNTLSKEGEDGFCMSCPKTRNDGKQSFTCAFRVTTKPRVITTFEQYTSLNTFLFRSWFSDVKHCKDISSDETYFKQYFDKGNKIYIFHVVFLGNLQIPISTNKNTNQSYVYYGNVRKGFNKFDDIYLEGIIKKQLGI